MDEVMVKLTVGDKLLRLRFDFNELADSESVTGCNLLMAIGAWPNLSCSQARALLYALLKPDHPKLLLKESGDLLTQDVQSGTKIFAAIGDLLMQSGVLEAPAPAPPPPTMPEAPADLGAPQADA